MLSVIIFDDRLNPPRHISGETFCHSLETHVFCCWVCVALPFSFKYPKSVLLEVRQHIGQVLVSTLFFFTNLLHFGSVLWIVVLLEYSSSAKRL